VLEQLRRIIIKITEINFVRAAIEEKADLSVFKAKPSLQVIVGIFLICLGSLLGWPAVAVLSILAVKVKEPLIAVIGGPLIYGISHLVFLLGMYFSGAKYSVIFFRWFVRVIVEKMLLWVTRQEA
jgi:hypothetical protein